MSVLSLDPGKTTGAALWTETGRLTDRMQLGVVDTLQLIDRRWKAIIIEGYRLDHRAGKQKGSELEASQIIGAVKLRALQLGIPAYVQQLESRDMGYVHSGMKKAADHKKSHDLDAIAHGYWWWESQGVVPDISLLLH